MYFHHTPYSPTKDLFSVFEIAATGP